MDDSYAEYPMLNKQGQLKCKRCNLWASEGLQDNLTLDADDNFDTIRENADNDGDWSFEFTL